MLLDKQSNCTLQIADAFVKLKLMYPETAAYFGGYLSNDPCNYEAVSVPKLEWEDWLAEGGIACPYGEYCCSTAAVSDALLKQDRCIIHAAAFRFQDEAWLIAGQSGVGKSTQVRNLQLLSPEDFEIICGDRPALELKEEGGVFVHPSPWNGKENWKGANGAFLSGIILLERGETNLIEKIPAFKVVMPLLGLLIHSGGTEDNILDLSRFEDALLSRVPFWKLTSFQVPESTTLMYESLFSRRSAL